MSGRILRISGIALLVLGGFALGMAVGNQTPPVVAGAAPSVLQQADAEEQGIVIVSVDADGAAAQAGVVRGDILLSVDDNEVNSLSDLQDVLNAHDAGDAVTLSVLHGDARRTLTATLDDRNGRAYLGVSSCGSVDAALFKTAPIELTLGAWITDVQPDSPAQAAGLAEGDRIVALDGVELDAESNLADRITARQPGDTTTLTIERAGEESREVTVTLGEHPDKEGVAYLGVTYSSLPHLRSFGGDVLPFGGDAPFFHDRLPFEFRFHEFSGLDKTGVIIGGVSDDSPASAAGLQLGDLITAVDGEALTSPDSLSETLSAHQPGDTVTLTVARSGEAQELQIEATLGESPDEEGQAYLGVTIGGFISTQRFDGGNLPDGFRLPDFQFRMPFDGFRFHVDPDVEPPKELDRSTSL